MEPNHILIPGDLPGAWRQRAEYLADFGDPNTARLWQLAATELDQALQVLGEESLSLVEAAVVSGASPVQRVSNSRNLDGFGSVSRGRMPVEQLPTAVCPQRLNAPIRRHLL